MDEKTAKSIHGGLSKPSKMPGFAYGLPAKECKVGSKLRSVPDSTCSKCYALKGRYMFKNVQDALYRRLAALSNPAWVEAMVYSISRSKVPYFRWHDSGDIQDMKHLNKIVAVAKACPGVTFWLPTREKALISQYLVLNRSFPSNLIVRVSAAMIGEEYTNQAFLTSSVVLSAEQSNCEAPKQEGKCLDCRKCWDPGVKNVAYLKH